MTYPSLNFALGETIDMLRDQVRGFVAAELQPRAAQIDQDNQFPMDMWRKFGEMGLLGITVDEEYGGFGAWATWPTSWPWKRSAGPRRRSACPMARIPTCASTRSSATATPNRRPATCRPWYPANTSARWR